MFKNRFFLYGLGIGLIAASLLLQLASMSSKLERDQEEPIEWEAFFEAHFDELSQAAQLQGYRIIKVEDSELEDSELEDVELEEPSANDEPLTEQADKELPPEPMVLDITYGMTSIDVADLLEQLHLIDDRTDFERAMSSRALNRRIQAGTYEFTDVPKLHDLIDLITN